MIKKNVLSSFLICTRLDFDTIGSLIILSVAQLLFPMVWKELSRDCTTVCLVAFCQIYPWCSSSNSLWPLDFAENCEFHCIQDATQRLLGDRV